MDVAILAEQTAQQNAEIVVKKTDHSEKTLSDTKDDDDSYNGHHFMGREDGDEKEEEKKFFENSEKIKKFKVTFNTLTNMVELVDQKRGCVIETINPNDLISIVSKSGNGAGFLVDREV